MKLLLAKRISETAKVNDSIRLFTLALAFLAFALLCLAPPSYASYNQEYAAAVKARLTPVGRVKLKTIETAPPKKLAAPATTVAVGEKIYNTYCATCHNLGLANAPKFRDTKDWQSRIAKGIDDMTQRAIKGFNAMPARGTCMTCSDTDFRRAVDYMLPQQPQ